MKRIVITGGSGDLGRKVAHAFSDGGWIVDAPGKNELDVTDPRQVTAYFAAREVDLLVCCAGRVEDRPLLKLDEASWDRLLAVNLRGAADCAREVFPSMKRNGGGHVVFISSRSAVHPPPGQAAYATAKAALLGLTKDLATRYGPARIRVNAVLPGFLETKMTSAVPPVRRSQILSDHVLGRFNTVGTVANFIRFLHEQLPHTSGQVFQLDNRP